jgi:hypothetical protein
LFSALLLLDAAALAAGDTVADEEAVRSVFRLYKAALMTGDGAAASAMVDRGTASYFEEVKRLALDGGAEEIKSRPFIDRLLVVTLRQQLEPAALRELSLEELLRRSVADGWIRPETVAPLDIGSIEIDGDRAFGTAVNNAAPADQDGGLGIRYEFAREEKEWKFCFASLVASLNQVVEQFTAQMGTDQDELIFVLVESLSGRKVMPEVWEKPQ